MSCEDSSSSFWYPGDDSSITILFGSQEPFGQSWTSPSILGTIVDQAMEVETDTVDTSDVGVGGEVHKGDPIQTITSVNMPRELANAPTSSLENTAIINTGVSSSPTRPTVRDSSWLELDVCREFLRDSCSRTAEECKYAHPTGSVVIKDGNKVTCCFDYLKVLVLKYIFCFNYNYI